jgi:hypothetical protein
MISDRAVRVAGVEVARVEEITKFDFDICNWTYDRLLEILRRVRPTADILDAQRTSGLSHLEKYCRCFAGDGFSEDHVPPRGDKPRFKDSMRDLDLIWSSNSTWNNLSGISNNFATHYAIRCASLLHGRCLFTATNDYFGLAPANTQKVIRCVYCSGVGSPSFCALGPHRHRLRLGKWSASVKLKDL